MAVQNRIVKLLDETFAGIEEAKTKAAANIKKSEALLNSHLHLTFRTPKRGWIESKLGSIGKVSMCKRILKEQTKPTGEIPFYKIGTFGKQPDAFIPESIYNKFRNKYPFPSKGDILISAAGTIGRRVRYDGEPAYFQDSNIVWIENDEENVLNNYLYHFYSACEWNSTSGATISRLYNDNLRSIDIVFPASLTEQQEIADQTDRAISEVKKLGEAYEQKEAAYSLLKAAILAQAFAGELTA
jgi:type I restriction enzyme S subunit